MFAINRRIVYFKYSPDDSNLDNMPYKGICPPQMDEGDFDNLLNFFKGIVDETNADGVRFSDDTLMKHNVNHFCLKSGTVLFKIIESRKTIGHGKPELYGFFTPIDEALSAWLELDKLCYLLSREKPGTEGDGSIDPQLLSSLHVDLIPGVKPFYKTSLEAMIKDLALSPFPINAALTSIPAELYPEGVKRYSNGMLPEKTDGNFKEIELLIDGKKIRNAIAKCTQPLKSAAIIAEYPDDNKRGGFLRLRKKRAGDIAEIKQWKYVYTQDKEEQSESCDFVKLDTSFEYSLVGDTFNAYTGKVGANADKLPRVEGARIAIEAPTVEEIEIPITPPKMVVHRRKPKVQATPIAPPITPSSADKTLTASIPKSVSKPVVADISAPSSSSKLKPKRNEKPEKIEKLSEIEKPEKPEKTEKRSLFSRAAKPHKKGEGRVHPLLAAAAEKKENEESGDKLKPAKPAKPVKPPKISRENSKQSLKQEIDLKQDITPKQETEPNIPQPPVQNEREPSIPPPSRESSFSSRSRSSFSSRQQPPPPPPPQREPPRTAAPSQSRMSSLVSAKVHPLLAQAKEREGGIIRNSPQPHPPRPNSLATNRATPPISFRPDTSKSTSDLKKGPPPRRSRFGNTQTIAQPLPSVADTIEVELADKNEKLEKNDKIDGDATRPNILGSRPEIEFNVVDAKPTEPAKPEPITSAAPAVPEAKSTILPPPRPNPAPPPPRLGKGRGGSKIPIIPVEQAKPEKPEKPAKPILEPITPLPPRPNPAPPSPKAKLPSETIEVVEPIEPILNKPSPNEISNEGAFFEPEQVMWDVIGGETDKSEDTAKEGFSEDKPLNLDGLFSDINFDDIDLDDLVLTPAKGTDDDEPNEIGNSNGGDLDDLSDFSDFLI